MKKLSLFLIILVVLSVLPVGATTATETQETPYPANFIPGEVLKQDIAPEKEYALDVFEALKELGMIDPISKPEYQFIVVEMPIGNVQKLLEIPGVLHVWRDKTVKILEPVSIEENTLPLKAEPSSPDMFMSIFEINAYDTWVNYGVLGDNVTVAVLDTGIDVGHPFLQVTLDGRPKIIDIYDASDEGIAQLYYATNTTLNGTIVVNMEVPVYWGAYYPYYGHDKITTYYNMTSYFVGNITGDEYYLGLLPERYFDLNNFFGTPNDPYNLGLFGDLSDVYPVLIVENNGTYTAYIDYNLNNNFTDDQPIGLFTETGDYFQTPDTLVSIALAKVHIGDMDNPDNYPYIVPYGDGIGYAMFMWDPHGHGTHVSGTVAGVGQPDDPMFRGVYGVAPNAQLIEVKVLPGEVGFGRTSWIINGMFYAALNGADVISMSLGGGGEINDGIESPENFYANMITDLFGVVFAIAAGNEGPSTNTVHSPGTSDLVITVGNYVGNEREAYWYGVDLGIMSGPSMSSSRGPRDDGMLDPDVMAPGTDIFSSLPMWYTVLYGNPYRYYGIWSGTSMATPHVSGTVALMISYAKQHGIRYDPFMIKRALELSAKPVNGTLIDQGFGLIQVDKAIEKLEELSQEPTTYIYGGTTFTSFKNPIEAPLIPISPAYVEFNSYFYGVFGLPYLYRGVYIRNEYPSGVPLYFYPLKYYDGYGLWYTTSEKTYTISTNVDWIIPSTNTVVAGGNIIGEFSINIDYSQLQSTGVHIGLVYIDDPDTSYIDGFIPVIVDYPMNSNGETHIKFSDTEKPGEAKHYFVKVPRGTKELRVTLRVPADENGMPMGRTKLVIARPLGGVVYDGVPGYYYVGANPSGNIYEYTWVVENPVEGTWEITAYSSTFTKYWSGYDESHYEIEVELASVSISPQLIRKDVDSPSVVDVNAVVTNNYGTFNASAIGYGLGRLDVSNVMARNVGQDEWDVVGVVYVDPTTYFIRFGITQPEDPSADLDLYVYYFPTYEDLLNFENYILYYEQIGPTSDEVFEQFMPAPGYYLIVVHGYDTVGYNPIGYVFYYQILGDNGDVSVDPTPFTFSSGSKTISAQVNLTGEGTYLGILGLVDTDTGESMVYAPMIFQVGQPEMYVGLMGTPTIGEPTTMTLKILDKATLEPIQGEVKVLIDGKEYYAVDGELKFIYTATSLNDAIFNVKVISDKYKDFEGQFRVSVKEPFTEFASESNISAAVLTGPGEITNFQAVHGKVSVTVSGETGTTSTVRITLPLDAYFIEVQSDHVVNYYIEKGKYAQYLFVTVKFASEVTIEVTYKTSYDIMRTMYMTWYLLYNSYSRKFDDLYAKAIELGVDNETLQEALTYKELAEENYNAIAEKFGIPIQPKIQAIPYIRRAYINIKTAYEILSEAIEDLETS
ncbi:S8 family peptidase [Thermococcus bergensis]|uniref:S8 family peptidase n=1 Tax=Thermococcus bergensis TaxID=2689387 RepID=UPI001CEDD66A|nr:S8 family serine peptidase [Thermococcus bergensis]